MSAYDDLLGELAEHDSDNCDDQFCPICRREEEAEAESGYDPNDDYRK